MASWNERVLAEEGRFKQLLERKEVRRKAFLQYGLRMEELSARLEHEHDALEALAGFVLLGAMDLERFATPGRGALEAWKARCLARIAAAEEACRETRALLTLLEQSTETPHGG